MVRGHFGVKRGGQRALPASAVSSAQNNRYATVRTAGWHVLVPCETQLLAIFLHAFFLCSANIVNLIEVILLTIHVLNIPISNILYIFILSTYIFIECN